MLPLFQAIALQMVGCCGDVLNVEQAAQRGPQGQSKLGAMV